MIAGEALGISSSGLKLRFTASWDRRDQSIARKELPLRFPLGPNLNCKLRCIQLITAIYRRSKGERKEKINTCGRYSYVFSSSFRLVLLASPCCRVAAESMPKGSSRGKRSDLAEERQHRTGTEMEDVLSRCRPKKSQPRPPELSTLQQVGSRGVRSSEIDP